MVHHYDLHEHNANIHTGITARDVAEITGMRLDLVCKYARSGYLYKGRYRVARHGEKVVENFKSNDNNKETGYAFPTEYRVDFAKRWDAITKPLKASGKIRNIRFVQKLTGGNV